MDAGPQGEITMIFEVSRDESGALASTLDVPTQGAAGIPTGETTFAHDTLTITVPAIQGRYQGVLSEDGSVVGTWSQGPATLPLTLTREGEVRRPERPQEPEPPFPYEVEEVAYENPSAGITLAGTFTRPRGGGPYPAVLMITGSGPQDRDETVMGHRPFLVIADHLTRNGVAVLRVDDRGVGGSGGDFATSTSRDFASDVRAGVTWLSGRSDVGSVGLVGHSEGGLIAPMVAAEDDRVAFIVLLSGPGVPGSEILSEQIGRIQGVAGVPAPVTRWNQELIAAVAARVGRVPASERFDSVRAVLASAVEKLTPEEREAAEIPADGVEAFVEGQARSLASPWMAFFLTHDPRSDLRRVTVPVLALGGSLDLQVPPEQSLPEIERAVREGGNQNVTVRELPGLNHLFQHARTGSPAEYASLTETFAPEALDILLEWILEVAGPRS
jgi:pimeloyl-ACP methyl ester carboxylesterase